MADEDVTLDAQEAIDQAAAVVSQIAPPPREITLSNGVKLKLRPVPPLALRQAAVTVPYPSVPLFRLPDGRDEPNPNDPDYLRACARFEDQQAARVSDVIILLGSRLDSVPEGIDRPEASGWSEMLEAVGITVDLANEHKRYLSWLRFYVLASESDIVRIISNVVRLSGVTEVEVAKAAAAFRNPS